MSNSPSPSHDLTVAFDMTRTSSGGAADLDRLDRHGQEPLRHRRRERDDLNRTLVLPGQRAVAAEVHHAATRRRS
jgi:hypothetical protein